MMAKVSAIMGVDCTSLYVKLELVEGPKQEHPQASSRLLGENSAVFFFLTKQITSQVLYSVHCSRSSITGEVSSKSL